MALERKWKSVPPQAFTANGSAFGLVTVADVKGFKVKQHAYLKNTAGSTLLVQVKRVLSPTKLIVGLIDNNLSTWKPLDITSWTIASGAKIGAEEQDKNNIPEVDHYKAIYEADPTVADRVIQVDQYGNFYDDDNPMPVAVAGSITIGNVTIQDDDGDELAVNPDGSINVNVVTSIVGEVISKYNEIVAVPGGATVSLVTYTVPAGKTAILQKSAVSGDNIGKYTLSINAVTEDTIRTMFGSDLTGMFDFTSGNNSGLSLNTGDIIEIKVLNPRPYVGDFNARIQVLEITP